jgi:hypothetical protein
MTCVQCSALWSDELYRKGVLCIISEAMSHNYNRRFQEKKPDGRLKCPHYCHTDLTVYSYDITVLVSGEQKHYFHLWGLQKPLVIFSVLVKTMFFTISFHCTEILHY